MNLLKENKGQESIPITKSNQSKPLK